MHRALLLSVAAVALGACNDVSSPSGRNGTVTVQAYIDRDDSGTLTAGDSILANFGVTLLEGDAVVATATTGADGKAVFANVAPGSYRVEAQGSTPTGAVLQTNPEPSAVISSRGDSVSVDFRFVFYPGTISGRVFRDDNGNGFYDAGVDTPGPGLKVFLRRTAAGAAIDSTVTDAQGLYTFRLLAPGTYFVTFENPTTISYGAAGATRQVTVAPLGTVTLSPVFTGSLIIKIREARGKSLGSAVAVQGYIATPPGRFAFTAGSEIWVQDSTGGIASFPVPTGDSLTFPLGQLVEVSGILSSNSGQLQIGATATPPTVSARTGSSIVVPLGQTAAQVNALTNDGKLVRVSSVRITSVPTGTGGSFTVRGVDFAGDTIQIRVAAATTGITRANFVVGNEYDITGELSQFGGAAQVKPRYPSDIALTVAVTSIGAARMLDTGTVVTVEGNVTVPPGLFTSGTGGVNSEIWVQDATGGIAVFSVPSADSATIRLGDVLRVTGRIARFNGQLQITVTGPGGSVVRRAAGTAPGPLVQTGVEINARTNEGRLVRLNNFLVTVVGGGTGAAFNVTGTADGATVTVRVSSAATGLTRANFVVGNSYSVVGVLSQFNGTAQIKPRFRTDVTP